MLVSFRERMLGSIEGTHGRSPISFEIEAKGGPALRFLSRGKTRIVGVISVPPFADAAPLAGRLEVSLIPGRTISYDFEFVGSDGEPYRFVGEKNVKLTHPVDGLTQMAGRLMRDGSVIASGRVDFLLPDLPSFLASWSLSPEWSPRLPLSESEREILRALADAMIPAGRFVPEVDELTQDAALRYLDHFPVPLLFGYRAGLFALESLSLATTRARFTKLSRTERTELLERVMDHAESSFASLSAARLVHLLTASIKLVHFGRADYARAIGHPIATPVAAEPVPRHFERVRSAGELDSDRELEADVVIVGTGAGGGALAKELAERGVAVLVIEEGGYQTRKDFSGPPIERMHRVWRDHGLTFAIGEPAIIVPLGRTVGGTTAINSGTCFRAPDRVLLEWVREGGFPEDFLPGSFGHYYDKVANELGVTAGTKQLCGAIGEVVGRGADAMGLSHGPLPRNAPDCDAQAECILGCPTGAKRSTDVSYVPRALKAGATVLTGLRAERFVLKGSNVRAIEARAGERKLLVRGRSFVLSMGSLMTPTFLERQGLDLPRLGKNLSVHPALGLVALMDEDMQPWHAVPQGYGFSGYEDEGICFEGFYLPPPLFPPMLPMAGRELTWWMDRFRNLGQFGFMVKDPGVGRVRMGPDGRSLIFYSADDATVKKLVRGIAVLSEVLIRGGAKQVVTGAMGVPPVTSVTAARALEDRGIRGSQLAALGAHPLGTCAMGANAERGVVDFEHRVFGFENLYVVDGSSVPTSLGVNPQMTIMAMATRAAELLARA
ncbi:MAG: GMC family oxidoreductase N-terminal domain-containing protein [Deltaproteobacteria bacterium]|nr:GMC family oxidoreductase N-terminal domain-containing protein [Deltaproteobacteria bacterium]